jgi:hypothetical protein
VHPKAPEFFGLFFLIIVVVDIIIEYKEAENSASFNIRVLIINSLPMDINKADGMGLEVISSNMDRHHRDNDL